MTNCMHRRLQALESRRPTAAPLRIVRVIVDEAKAIIGAVARPGFDMIEARAGETLPELVNRAEASR